MSDDDAPLVHSCVQDTAQDSVTADATATSGRRRRLRALPWSWDSDTESDTDPKPSEVAVSSNVPPEVLDAMERDLTMDPHESVTQAPSGLLPTWVDEASNPGPGDIRNARRLRSTQLDCESVEEEAIQVHGARSSVDHEGRVAVPLRQTVPATTKRLRLTCRNHHRM